jgi:hypothetical protein
MIKYCLNLQKREMFIEWPLEECGGGRLSLDGTLLDFEDKIF